MFKQDFIMRVISEAIRTILKLVFHIDADTPKEEVLQTREGRDSYDDFIRMIDRGEINEAENQLYEIVDGKDKEALKIALLFYSHLNEKDDDFLEEHDYSREEIQMGVRSVSEKYGVDSILDVFSSNR